MSRIWVTSDWHLGHKKILTFTDDKGELIRGKLFKDIEHHDQSIIDNCNKVVHPSDHLYILGDVVIGRKHLDRLREVHGHKRLVMGNHDIFRIEEYLKAGFEKICGVRVFEKHNIIFSHIPIHRDSLVSRGWLNIHGHLHNNTVLLSGRNSAPDPLYRNVSLEQTGYKPVLIFDNGKTV